MEYIIIGICVVAAIAVGVVLYLKRKQKKEVPEAASFVASNPSRSELLKAESAKELVIQMEMLPVEDIGDETRLVEITDSKVLVYVNNLVPGLAQVGNAVNNAAQSAKANVEVLYRAIIPAGKKLTDSKAMEGAVRGFFRGIYSMCFFVTCFLCCNHISCFLFYSSEVQIIIKYPRNKVNYSIKSCSLSSSFICINS